MHVCGHVALVRARGCDHILESCLRGAGRLWSPVTTGMSEAELGGASQLVWSCWEVTIESTLESCAAAADDLFLFLGLTDTTC